MRILLPTILGGLQLPVINLISVFASVRSTSCWTTPPRVQLHACTGQAGLADAACIHLHGAIGGLAGGSSCAELHTTHQLGIGVLHQHSPHWGRIALTLCAGPRLVGSPTCASAHTMCHMQGVCVQQPHLPHCEACRSCMQKHAAEQLLRLHAYTPAPQPVTEDC